MLHRSSLVQIDQVEAVLSEEHRRDYIHQRQTKDVNEMRNLNTILFFRTHYLTRGCVYKFR